MKDATVLTKLSEPTIANIYMRVRMKLKTNGLFQFQVAPDAPAIAKPIWGPKQRGAPKAHHQLHEIEFIHRVLCGQNYRYVERLAIADPKQYDRLMRLYHADRILKRYNFIELLKVGSEELKPENHRPFNPADVHDNAIILINERMIDANAAFFRYLWGLLLRSPLDAG